MIKIGFVFNPFSGGSKKVNLEQLINLHVDATKYLVSIFPTTQGSDIEKFTHQMVENKYDIAVACGGDGTVNIMAGILAGSDTALGILPMGSGNGLARHLGIPGKLVAAIKHLQKAKVHPSDLGMANGLPFINVAGIGYDAQISHKFALSTKRGYWGYVSTMATELNYKPQEYRVTADNFDWKGKAWLVAILNGAQWGNGVNLFPNASIHDGILHAVIFKKQKSFQVLRFGFRALTKSLHKSPDLEIVNAAQFTIEAIGNSSPLHLDGEPAGHIESKLEVNVLKGQLKILY